MQRRLALLLALITLAPATAAAIDYYEEGLTFTYFGSVGVIARDAEFYEGIPKPFVEVECESTNGPQAVHVLMTPDEARAFAAMLVDGADAAEAP